MIMKNDNDNIMIMKNDNEIENTHNIKTKFHLHMLHLKKMHKDS